MQKRTLRNQRLFLLQFSARPSFAVINQLTDAGVPSSEGNPLAFTGLPRGAAPGDLIGYTLSLPEYRAGVPSADEI